MADQKKDVGVVVKAIDAVTAPLNEMKGKFDSFLSGVKGALASAGILAAMKIFTDFFRDAIGEAVKAEGSINRLGQAVRNAGGNFDVLGPALNAAVDGVTKLSTATDDDLREALTRLVTMTGDTGASMKSLGLVADVAAYKHIGVADAADLVGKAMNGNAKVLKEFGIEGGTTAERMAALRQEVAGFAKNEAESMGGRLQILHREWGEFKEAIGTALLGTDNLGEGVTKLTEQLVKMQHGVEENKATLQGLGRIGVDVGAVVAGVAGSFGKLLVGFVQGWEALLVSLPAGVEQLGIRVKMAWATLTGNDGMKATLTNELAASQEAWRNAVAEIGGIADAGETVIDTGMRGHAAARAKISKDAFEALAAVAGDGAAKLSAGQKAALDNLLALRKAHHLTELHLSGDQIKALDAYAEAGHKQEAETAKKSHDTLLQLQHDADKVALELLSATQKEYEELTRTFHEKMQAMTADDRAKAVKLLGEAQAALLLKWADLYKAVKPVVQSGEVDTRRELVGTQHYLEAISAAIDKYGNHVDGAAERSARFKVKVGDLGNEFQSQARRISDLAHNMGSVLGDEVLAKVDAITGSIQQLGEAMGDLAKGDYLGAITKGVGAIVSGVKSLFGKSEAEKKLEEALGKNSHRLEELRGKIGDLLGLNATGRQISGTQSALQEFFASGGASKKGWGDRLGQLLLSKGLTMNDVEDLAKTLGINIHPDGTHLDPAALRQLLQGIGAIEPTTFAQTFAGQRERISSGKDIGTVTDELGEAVKLISDPKLGAPAIADALKGLDLSTEGGKALGVAHLQDLFANIDKVGAAGLGGLTGSEFLDAIKWIIGLLKPDTGGLSAGPTTGTVDTGTPSAAASNPITAPTPSGPSLLDVTIDSRDFLKSIDTNVMALMPALTASANIMASLGEVAAKRDVLGAAVTIEANITGDFHLGAGADPGQLDQLQATLQTAQDRQIKQIEQALARNFDRFRAGAGNATRNAA